MSVHAVIFDLDGTLLNTIDDIANSMNSALERFDWPTHTIERYRSFIGDGIDLLVQRALPTSLSNDNSAQRKLRITMEKEYSLRWNEYSQPYPDIPTLLDELTIRQIPTAVLSNKPEPFTYQCVNKLLLPWKFDVVRGARPNTPKKPDPTSAIEIAQLLGIDPVNIIFLGDTDTDMLTARAAGMVGIGVTWGFRSSEELKSNGACHLIDQPLDLLQFIS